MRALLRAFRVFSATGLFLGFFVGGPILALLVLPRVLVGPRETRHLRARTAMARGFRAYLSLLRMFRVIEVRLARTPDATAGPVVYVANHPSILDIVPLCASLGPICIIVRHTAERVLFFDVVTRMCRYVVIRDGSLGAAEEMMASAVDRLGAGESLLVFPEGTRSPPEGFHPFSRAPFDIAGRAGVPVVPVAIHATSPVLKKGGSFLDWPAELVRFDIRVLPAATVAPGRSAARAARDHVVAVLAEAVDVRQSPAPLDGEPLGVVHGA